MLSNLALVYPESTEKWRVQMRRRVYDSLGWTVTETLALQRDPAQALDWIDEVDDPRHVEEFLAKGKGVLLLSGHYGNWELLAAWYAQYFGKKGLRNFQVVAQKIKDEDVDRVVTRCRRNAGVNILPKHTPTLDIVKLLKGGAHVGVMPDVSWVGGLVLPFMGQPCTNTIGPAVLSMLGSVPVVPVTIYRAAPFRHKVVILPPLQVPEGADRRVKIELLTREINSTLEKMIAPRPEQWFWLHNRWKK